MSRSSRLLRSLLLGWANQAAILLVGLWLTPFLLGRLGRETVGLWLAATPLLGYLALLDLGVVALLPRELARETGRSGQRQLTPEIQAMVLRVTRLAVLQTPAVGALALLLWCTLPSSWAPLRAPLGLTFAVFTLAFPLRVVTATLQGIQELSFGAWAQLLSWAAGTMTTVVVVIAGGGLPALAYGWVVQQVLALVMATVRLLQLARLEAPVGSAPLTRDFVRHWIARSGWLSVSQLANALLLGSDVVLISRVLGPSPVVVFSCTSRLSFILATQINALVLGALPGLSELHGEGDRAALRRACTSLTLLTLFASSLAAAVFVAVDPSFVSWWVGPGNLGSTGLVLAIALCAIGRHLTLVTGFELFCLGRERLSSISALLNGVAAVGLSVAALHHWDLTGAPVAYLAAGLLVAVPLNLFALSRELAVRVVVQVRSLVPLLLCSLVAVLISHQLGHRFGAPRVNRAVVLAGVGAIIYLVLCGPFLLREPLRGYTRSRLHQLRLRWYALTRSPGLGQTGQESGVKSP